MAVYEAVTASRSDVSNAIDSAESGDTIIVPSGIETWASDITVSSFKRLTIQGAGIGKTIITGGSFYTSADYSRITGFQFNDATLVIEGDNWRIDNCKFYNSSTPKEGVYVYGTVLNHRPIGLVDNCIFYNSRVLATGTAAMLSENYTQHYLWNQPLSLGTADAVYVEDCTFQATSLYNAIDSNYGGRYVLRYCDLVDIYIEAHSVQGYNRAARSWEIYNNTIAQSAISVYMPFRLRGGTGVVFNNTLSGSFTDLAIGLDNYRSCNNVAPWGLADGTSYADGNTSGENGWPCRDQIGRGGDDSLWTDLSPYPAQSSAPAYLWNNKHGTNSVIGKSIQCAESVAHIQVDRDYFDSVHPTYSEYEYPHPLRGENLISLNASIRMRF